MFGSVVSGSGKLLHRLRAALRMAVPAALMLDQIRSVSEVARLVQQRFEEWEVEEREDTHREITALLCGVVQRCAAMDREFRPLELGSSAPPDSPDSPDSASGSFSKASSDFSDPLLWQLLGLAGMPSTSGDTTGMQTIPAVGMAQPPPQQQQLEQEQHTGSSPAAAAPADTHQPVVVVTLQEAAAHVGAASIAALQLLQPSAWWGQASAPPPGVEHVTLSDVLHILGGTAPARAAADEKRRLQRRVLAAADSAGERLCHAGLPWPQLRLSRRSALRCSLEWQGLRWPRRRATTAALERDLSHC